MELQLGLLNVSLPWELQALLWPESHCVKSPVTLNMWCVVESLKFPVGSNFFQKYCCCFSVTKSCLTLCDSVDSSTPASSVLHYLSGFAQIHVRWVTDAIPTSYPLSPPSLFAFNISKHQGLFQSVGFSHQVAKVLEFQLQQESLQWVFRVVFL